MRAHSTTRRCLIALSLSAAVLISTASWAQEFPERPVRLVVAGPPGGGTDFLARLLAEHLTARLKQPVVVENRAGASGIIGTKFVVASPPDGHVIMLGHVATHAIVPAMHQPPPYDALKDFVPISLIGTAPDVLVVAANSPYQSIQDLLKAARENPGSITYGSPGVGLPQHLMGFMLGKSTNTNLRHVPYKGSAPALNDLVGGHISAMFVTAGAVVPFIRDGRVRALAVTSPKRSVLMAAVPTVAELGLPSLEQVGWFGVFAPAKTPTRITELLGKQISEVMSQPDVQARVEAQFTDPVVSSATQFAEFHRNEVRKWTEIVQESGVRADQ